MDLKALRAWWSHRQGLDATPEAAKPAEILFRTGWARSVGGTAPYLGLFVRAGTSREAVDKAQANLEIHELPAARGCTYVVPSEDFALALKAGESFGDAEVKVAAKLGVTEKEIGKLCDAVVKALEDNPLEPDEIRQRVGKAARSLGEEGKKKGLSSTLPVALGKLQAIGEIRRVSLTGRLDQQRYRYTLWRPNPCARLKLSPEQVSTELARRYFSWIGPAALVDFQAFSGLGVKASKAAVEPLKLEGVGDYLLLLPEDRPKFEAFRPPKDPHYVLVSTFDGIALFHHDRSLLLDKGTPLPHDHSSLIFDRGQLVGAWEYDTQTESIVWASFIKKNKDLESAVKRTQDYIRAQLGDVRLSSIDNPKGRAPRIEAIRKAAAG